MSHSWSDDTTYYRWWLKYNIVVKRLSLLIHFWPLYARKTGRNFPKVPYLQQPDKSEYENVIERPIWYNVYRDYGERNIWQYSVTSNIYITMTTRSTVWFYYSQYASIFHYLSLSLSLLLYVTTTATLAHFPPIFIIDIYIYIWVYH